MSIKTILRGGTASLVILAAIGIGSASAQYYGDQQQSSRHGSSSYRHSSYRSDRSDEVSMRGHAPPPAFQMPLIGIPDAKDVLRRASVRDEDGNSVGTVRDVVASRDGEVQAVKINIGGLWGMGTKTVMVDARDFRYERDRNELTADLSKGQIDSMPGVKG